MRCELLWIPEIIEREIFIAIRTWDIEYDSLSLFVEQEIPDWGCILMYSHRQSRNSFTLFLFLFRMLYMVEDKKIQHPDAYIREMYDFKTHQKVSFKMKNK